MPLLFSVCRLVRLLARLGDPRPGVGLNQQGWPDIAWCDVPISDGIGRDNSILQPLANQGAVPVQTKRGAFRIARYPITNAQYQAFVNDGGYQGKRWWTTDNQRTHIPYADRQQHGNLCLPNHPMVGVNAHEAVAFCKWLTEKLGIQVRIPTETEWEKAAQGTDGRRYPWGEEITPHHANYADAAIDSTSAVGIFVSGTSPYGAMDMSGNVREWCVAGDDQAILRSDNAHTQPSFAVRGVLSRHVGSRYLHMAPGTASGCPK